MRSIALTLIAAIALPLLTAASSETPAMTAADLAQLCGGTDHVSVNACRIYILGVTQGIDVGMRLAGARGNAHRPCVPPKVSAEELDATVKQRLAALGPSITWAGAGEGWAIAAADQTNTKATATTVPNAGSAKRGDLPCISCRP